MAVVAIATSSATIVAAHLIIRTIRSAVIVVAAAPETVCRFTVTSIATVSLLTTISVCHSNILITEFLQLGILAKQPCKGICLGKCTKDNYSHTYQSRDNNLFHFLSSLLLLSFLKRPKPS
jgi:hypothetical protein